MFFRAPAREASAKPPRRKKGSENLSSTKQTFMPNSSPSIIPELLFLEYRKKILRTCCISVNVTRTPRLSKSYAKNCIYLELYGHRNTTRAALHQQQKRPLRNCSGRFHHAKRQGPICSLQREYPPRRLRRDGLRKHNAWSLGRSCQTATTP